MRSRVVAIITAGVLAGALSSCAGSTEGLAGAALFERSCAGCHLSDGRGGSGPAIGAGSRAASDLSDEQIAGVIRAGPGAMPSFSRFSDEQVDSLVTYLRSIQAGLAP